MGITTIKRLENRSNSPVKLLNIENEHVPSNEVTIAPGTSLAVSIFVPWAAQAQDFPEHHLELQFDGQTRYWIWQAARVDGDFVRFSSDGQWHDPGARVYGISVVQSTDIPGVDGDRTVMVFNDGFQLVSFPDELITALQGGTNPRRFWLCDSQPTDQRHPSSMRSVPKMSAVAFSMAGIPSDAYDLGQPGSEVPLP